MVLAFTPVAALTKLYSIEPNSAKVLTAGMALFAAAGIVSAGHVDIATMGLVGLYVVALGLLLIVVANLPALLRVMLGSFVVVMIMTMIATVFAASVTEPSWPKPSYCLVKFWLPCVRVEEAYAERNARSLDAGVDVAAAATVSRVVIRPPTVNGGDRSLPRLRVTRSAPVPVSSRAVFIHFAGSITRDSITELNSTLRGVGWNMQGRSGERIEAAAGLNELRYGQQGDREAAALLAAAVSRTGIAAAPVVPRFMAVIGPKNMELWISH
jgi:hypothetical protein